MNTTPEQFRLAADLKESGRPWQMTSVSSKEHWLDPNISIETALWEGRTIRPLPISFPPIPEGMNLHNPDGLTAEQVGDGYRLTVAGETPHESARVWGMVTKVWKERGLCQGDPYDTSCTYRIPIQTPFPDGSRIVDGKLVEPPKRLPLGPSDIPPGSALRHSRAPNGLWCAPSEVGQDGLLFWSYKAHNDDGESMHVSWEKLMDYLILRPGQTDWQPCSKTA